MNIRFMLSIAAAVALLLISCDDTTDDIGISLTDNADQIQISSEVFTATSRSVAAKSIVSRSSTGYLGRIIDPETGAHITADFMTQFFCFDGFSMISPDSIANKDANGEAIADSCELRLFYNSYYGDSLATMKLTVYEMGTPMPEDIKYYTDFSPLKEGYVREDGIHKDHAYTLINKSETREKDSTDSYVNNIRMPLNDPYTDKDGVTYNNFGTYVMRQYYSHPEYFKSTISFINHVVPGFYFKMTGGLGSMAYVISPQLNIFYSQRIKADSIASKLTLFSGTEEVLQTTTVSNDEEAISQLVNDKSCTYIKSPSGIFTEVTIPVDEIMKGHENDTINSAKIIFNRINNGQASQYNLPAPTSLLMLEADSVAAFFEGEKVANYKDSYISTYSASLNRYAFNNISGLVTAMYHAKTEGVKSDPNWLSYHPNWNKVMLIPVTTTYTTFDQTSVLSGVSNDMSLTSTRLVGGDTPITISVIYSSFK